MAISTQKMDRYSLGFLGAIGLCIVVLGYWQIHTSIFSYRTNVLIPTQQEIAKRLAAAQNNASASLGDTTEAQRLADLQTKDSDADGLNDFDEQYVYGTSIYLSDSDSDGKKDKEEVDGGTNPTCGEGQECRTASKSTISPETQISAAALDAFSSLNPNAGNSNNGINAAEMEKLASDPQALRDFLKSKGVDEQTLKNTDDATLLQLAKDAASATTDANGALTDPVAAMNAQAQQIQGSSIEQKRQLLVQSGVSEAEVKKLSDEEVNSVIGQATNQALKSYTDTSALLGGASNSTTNGN